jgi:DNA-binding CsgD family transcriptional regulator
MLPSKVLHWRAALQNRGTSMKAMASRPGLVLVDESLNLVAANFEAVQILAFPESPEKLGNLGGWLTKKIHSCLVERKSSSRSSFVTEFRSAKRTYLCRAFPLNTGANVPARPTLALMLERKSNGGGTVEEISERFGLTPREQETMRLLAEGFCSKEIAARMKISPNTVKAFVHLVMVKMGVSTRSGIIGKMIGVDNTNHTSDREKKPNVL